MRRCPIVVSLVPLAAIVGILGFTPTIHAQQVPRLRSVGVHFGSNLSNFSDDPLDMVRVGVQAVVSLFGPVSLYPVGSAHLDRAQWQYSGLVRIDPTPGRATVPFYFGAGFSTINWDGPGADTYDALFFGLKAGIGKYQPFLELLLLDVLGRFDTSGGGLGIQLHLGINRHIT